MMRLGFLLPALLLAGCAASQPQWVKPGAAPEQAASDEAACRAQARAIVNQTLGADVDRLNLMSAPPTLSGQSSNMLGNMQRDQLADVGHRRELAETTDCMRGKGYIAR
jgi:hypothetical protein